ncbi:MAG: 3'(2'),5'-bisphosphate nucleotidase CysQ [Spirochaetales bacterium]
MTSSSQLHVLLPKLCELAVQAGREILDVYRSGDFGTERKADDSPLTIADKRAHDILSGGLARTAPDIPILSEEGRHAPYGERKTWEELFLVDPLDGTKEFINRQDDFTVNIAIVQRHDPVLGVIYAPVTGELWAGVTAPRIALKATVAPDATRHLEDPLNHALPITSKQRPIPPDEPITVMVSRTHLNEATDAYLSQLRTTYRNVDQVNVGSSIKLCRVAEGKVDLYPRYAPTSEWDIAAGHAVVRAAGGEVYRIDSDRNIQDEPLRYNKEHLLNPWFLVKAW